MSKIGFILGWLRFFFNPRISPFSFISNNCIIDKHVTIYRGVKIKGSKIGRYSYIAAKTDIENAEIGKYCSIADNCRVGMANHPIDRLSTSPLFSYRKNACKDRWVEQDINEYASKRVFVGNDVWIGSHALILGGVRIGDGAVIGAGAVVTKDVPPYTIVGGVPAKFIKNRFSPEIIESLLSIQWWDLPENEIRKKVHLFQKEEVSDSVVGELRSVLE